MKMSHCGGPLVVLSLAVLLGASSFAEEKKDKKEPGPQIVAKVLKVKYAVQEIDPPNLVVTATGQVPTGGYMNVKLVRAIYATPPDCSPCPPRALLRRSFHR